MRDEFFVGYLKTPRGLNRFSLGVGALALGLVALVSFALAYFQRTPGKHLERAQYGAKLSGLYLQKPYPMVFAPDEDGALRGTFLVRPGKSGTPSRGELNGKPVALRGLKLERDQKTLFEVYELRAAEAAAPIVAPQRTAGGRRKLKGVIVDSKCYYGRMRPGDGKPHRACAQYCIDSGIPPLLVTSPDTANSIHYVIVGPHLEPIHHDMAAYAAEFIEVEGEAFSFADLLYLAIEPDSIKRTNHP